MELLFRDSRPLAYPGLLYVCLFWIRYCICPMGLAPKGGPMEISPTTQATCHHRAHIVIGLSLFIHSFIHLSYHPDYECNCISRQCSTLRVIGLRSVSTCLKCLLCGHYSNLVHSSLWLVIQSCITVTMIYWFVNPDCYATYLRSQLHYRCTIFHMK